MKPRREYPLSMRKAGLTRSRISDFHDDEVLVVINQNTDLVARKRAETVSRVRDDLE